MDSKVMFATMSPWRLFFTVAIPGMISMLAMSIYSTVEGAFIGHKLGETAMAAVNIAMPIVIINFSIADLVGVGSSVPISVSLGRKDEETANNIFSCSIILIFFLSLIMGIVMFFGAKPLASLIGADGELLDTSARYIQTYALCSPLTTIFFAMDNYLRISGYIKTSMLINVFSNAVTVGLLVVFLFVFQMDVVGSALATCISMCLCSFAAMVPFVRGKALLKFRKPHFSFSMIKKIAACGSPTFLNNIAGRVTSILINISLMTLGQQYLGENGGRTAVAAYSVLMYANEVCQPLIYGMSDALAPAIGFNYGAGDTDRLKKILRCNYIGSVVVSIVTTAVMFFFPGMVASIFVEADNAALAELAPHALRLFCLTYLVRWFVIVSQSFLSAIEKPIHATILSVAVALVCPAIVLGLLWWLGLDGLWMNMLGASILASILALVLVISTIKKIEHKKARSVAEND